MEEKLLPDDEEDFDFQIFECVDSALSRLGHTEKELFFRALARQFSLSGVDIAKNPSKLEECFKEILGKSGSAFILIHILDNISRSFKIDPTINCNLAEAIDQARQAILSRKQSYLVISHF
jgi:predicted nucleotide-binding protein (sugar kinase/HSP70/actin superfamily)